MYLGLAITPAYSSLYEADERLRLKLSFTSLLPPPLHVLGIRCHTLHPFIL